MKNILFVLCCLLVLPAAVSRATTPVGGGMTPIQSITLTYNLDKSILHVDAAHPSDSWEKDYVRMMVVSLNGQLVGTFNYYRQKAYEGFSEDVPMKAQVGDTITVELFCTQGSSLSQDLTVTPPPPEK